jgi:hypothetical protein
MHSATDLGLGRTKKLPMSGESKRKGEKKASQKEGKGVRSKQSM